MISLKDHFEENNVYGCSDGFCYFTGKSKGIHTNGGCRCLEYRPHEDRGPALQKVIHLKRVLLTLHSHIEKLETELSELGEGNDKQR